MFERRLFFHVDWLLLGAILMLAGIGVAMIYSTTYRLLPDGSGGYAGREFWTQLYALGLGGIALLICLTIDYRALAEHSLLIYAGLLGLLVFVLVAGDSAGGAQRWIALGPFKLQPSEFGRITLALILAMYFGENRRGAKNSGDLIIAGLFAAVPFLMIAKQPDLGTAVTLLPVCFGIMFLAGGDVSISGNPLAGSGFEGLVYAGAQCKLSGNPSIYGNIACANGPQPAGSTNITSTHDVSGNFTLRFDCSATVFNKRRVLTWYPKVGV